MNKLPYETMQYRTLSYATLPYKTLPYTDMSGSVIDTVAPAAPILAIQPGADAATASEAAAGAVTVSAENGSSVSVTFTGANGASVVKTLAGTGAPQAVALTPADLTVLGDGMVSVASTATDAAGNTSPAAATVSFTLDTAIAAPVVALVADSGVAGDLITNNGALSITGIEPGAPVEYSVDGGATWTTAFAAVEGANSVSVRQTDLAGNVSSATVFNFVLDTVAPGALLVSTLNGDMVVDNTEAGAATQLNIVPAAADESVLSVTVSGADILGNPISANGFQDANGAWMFDATQFADGNLTVQTNVTDVAGNARLDAFALTKSTVDNPAHVDAGGDAFINQWESSPWTTLNVVPTAGDAINSVTISGAGALGNAISTVATRNGFGYEFDATQFGDGPLTVVVNVTGVSGTAINAAPVTLTKDTLVGVASVNVGGDAFIDATEVSTATQLNLTKLDAGDTVQSVQVTGLGAGGWVGINATQDAAGNWVFDATQFTDGHLTVYTFTTDAAGNARWDIFALTRSTVAAGTVHADVGGDAFVNQWESSPWTTLNVIPSVGDTINSVTVSGADALGNAVSALATWNGFGYEFNATQFTDGPLTVVVNVTGVSGTAVDVAPVTLTKDTVIGGVASVNVGGDVFIDATEASTATVLNLTQVDAGDTVQQIQVSGLTAGGWNWVNATQDAAGNWVFDATQFVDGNLSVQINTTDAAGNGRSDAFALTKSTVPAGTVHADVGGDAFVNHWESSPWTTLNVVPAVGDAINSVTIGGTDVLGNAVSTVATWNGTSYSFDATLFADGALTVTVNVTGVSGTAVDAAPVTLTKDTLAGVASVNVGGDAFIDATEVSTATVLNLTMLSAGDTVQSVQVSGPATGVWWNWVNATQDAAGNWVFDSTQFVDGSVSVQTYTTDVAGNARWDAFVLTKSTLPPGTVLADVGGDAFVNQWENQTWTMLNVIPAAGDAINSVTISGTDVLGNAVSTVATRNGLGYEFNATQFTDGPLTVVVNVTGVSGTAVDVAPVTLTKDTFVSGVVNINVGGDAFIDATEGATATVLNLVPGGGVGETVQSVQLSGQGTGGWWITANATQDAAGNWVFDATQFVDGLLTVQSTVVDTAGNTVTSSFNLIKNMVPLGTAQADVGGDTYINQWEAGWTTLNVIPTAGDAVNSVTVLGADANGNTISAPAFWSAGNSYNFWSGPFADGTVTVLLNVTSGTTGSTYQALVNLTKDTFISGIASVTVGGDAFIGASETSTATPLSFAVSAGETVQTVQVYGQDAAGWWQWVNATQDAAGNWVFDATQFVNGGLTVQTTTVDVAGNSIMNSFALTKNSVNVAAGAVQVDAGGDAFINQAETGWPGVQLHVQTAAGDAINSVTISGADALGNAVSTLATWNGMNYTFDATPFAEGALTVTVNVTGVSGTAVDAAPVTLTKDTLIGVASINVGGDAFIDATEVSTATQLNLTRLDAGDTVQSVQVIGPGVGGWQIGVNATQDAAGNWVFDATQFMDGNLSVYTYTTDAAGNARWDVFAMTKSTVPTGMVHADVGGDAFVNQWESSMWTTLNVVPAAGDTINGVTINGADALGNAVSTLATRNGTNYMFDATLFADGALTVTANVTGVSGTAVDVAPVTLTKDTLVGVASVTVGGDAVIDATEVSTATVLSLTRLDAADTVQSVQVGGLTAGGWWNWVNAMQDAAGNWVFDSTQFVDGNLSVSTYSTDAAGNARWDAFALTRSTVATGTVHADVGGDAFVNQWESSPWTMLNVVPAAGDAINSVTVSGTDVLGNAASTLATRNGASYSFDATLFADGALTVTANVTGVSGTAVDVAPVTLTKDTVIGGVASVNVGGDAFIDATEISTATVLNLVPGGGVGETVQSVQVTGLTAGGWWNWVNVTQDAAGNWVFDSTQFVDGNLTVQINTTDAAGNVRWDAFALTKSAQAAGNVHVDAGGDAFINQWESSPWTNLNVVPAAGDTINSVTISGANALGNAVSTAATWNGTNYTFDATLFADGALTVTANVTGVSGTAVDVAPVTLTKDTLIRGVSSVNVGGDVLIDMTEASTATALNPNRIDANETVQGVQVIGVTAVGGWAWANATQDAAGNWAFDATQFVDGNLTVQTFTVDPAGNMLADVFSLTKATMNPVTYTQGGATTVSVNDTVYQDVSTAGAPLNDTFTVLASTNATVLAGEGTDTVILAGAAANTAFTRLDGGAGAADTLQLSANYSAINFSSFNYAGLPVIQGFEAIDLATDAGADSVTLTAADVFNMGSQFVDASTGAHTVIVTGDGLDTANILAGGFVQQAGVFDTTGTADAAGGFSKYVATYNNMGGALQQVELLMQNGVVIV